MVGPICIRGKILNTFERAQVCASAESSGLLPALSRWKDVKDVRRARKLKSTMCINKLHWSCRYGGPWGTRTPDIYPVNLS